MFLFWHCVSAFDDCSLDTGHSFWTCSGESLSISAVGLAWSYCPFLCICIFPPTGPLNRSEEFHFFQGTWIPRFLGQPLTWALAIGWSPEGCRTVVSILSIFSAKTSHHFFATFLFWPRWVLHSYFKFLIIQTLWLLHPCIPSPISCARTHWWALHIRGNSSRSIPHPYPTNSN